MVVEGNKQKHFPENWLIAGWLIDWLDMELSYKISKMGIHEYGWRLESNNYNKYYGWVPHWYIPNQVNSWKYWGDVINRKWK